jgi:beta-glucosidase
MEFDIKNSGNYDGDEIVQIYIKPLSGQNIKPIQLKGFKRISLKKNEKKRVSATLPLEAFSFYNDGLWNISSGEYECLVGSSSEDIRLTERIYISGKDRKFKIRNNYFSKFRL